MGSKKFLKYAAPVAGAILGSTILPGIGFGISAAGGAAAGAAAGSGGYNYSQTHNLGSALANAAGTYAGSQIAGPLIGDKLGTVGGTLSSVIPSGLSDAISGALPASLSALGGTTLGSVLGGSVGGDLASSLVPQKTKNPVGESAAPAFKPTRAGALNAPLNLGGLTDQQQSSNIATQGVYGGGAAPEDQNYFLNLINRRLVDDSGNVDSNFNDIGGVENSYLAQLGLGNKKNPTDLLQAISSWRA